MNSPQPGIFEENSNQFYFLEYQIDFSRGPNRIKSVLRQILNEKPAELNLVMAFGAHSWSLLNPQWKPEQLSAFEQIDGKNGFSIPATQQDVFFWIHSNNHDKNFDLAMRIQYLLSADAELNLHQSGFTYHDSRDLIGFVDGTANPKEDDRFETALIPKDQLGAGGSYVMSQKWIHKLKDFKNLKTSEQEKVVGRTKEDNIELEGEAMPENSHVSRTDIKSEGVAQKIYRRSAPFGDVKDKGLYFLAFACEQNRFDRQLRSMYGLTEDGIQDRIIEFSSPVTSSYWFAPSMEDLINVLE